MSRLVPDISGGEQLELILCDSIRRDTLPGASAPGHNLPPAMSHDLPYFKWMCLICGFIYDEAKGLPDEGLPAGTRWDEIPPNWTCPECGARKEDFEMVEI
jgi:rubredoxin